MNVKQFSWIAIVMCASFNARAQPYAIGIRSQAMGGTGAASGQDAETIFTNPALLPSLKGITATVFYSRPFGLREVHLASLATAARIAGMSCALAMVDFGSAVYHDQYYHAALARGFGKESSFAVAMSAHLRHLAIQGYGSAMALGVNLGTAYRINSRVQWGVFLGNLNQPKIGAAREKLPPSVCAGMAYSPHHDWMLQLDFYRELGFAEEIRFGIETRVLSILLLRLGAATNPDRFSAGFTIAMSNVAAHVAANTHNDLGATQFYAISIGHMQHHGEKNP